MRGAIALTSQKHQFKDFPQDDNLYWIRWFDGYSTRHGDTGTPAINVYLSQITSNNLNDLDYFSMYKKRFSFEFKQIQKTAPIISVPTAATNIPGLIIGGIYKNGVLQSELPGHQAQITLNTIENPQTIEVCSSPFKHKPEWLKNDNIYMFLNKFEYKIDELWNKSFLCVVRKNCTSYLFPCPEILRYFYCWNSKMVQIFTKGPWSSRINEAININDSGIVADGSWHLKARLGFKLSECGLLAPLYFDKSAMNRANDIYYSLLEKNNAYSSSYIKAMIPFRDGDIKLKVSGISLEDNKFLVLRILEHDWPYQNTKLITNLDNYNVIGTKQDEVNRPSPFSGGTSASADEEVPLGLTSAEDPNERSEQAHLPILGPQIRNIETAKPKKDVSYIYITPEHITNVIQELSDRSTGNPQPSGEVKRATLVASEDHESISRFEELLSALKELQKRSAIISYRPLSPPTSSTAIRYGNLPLMWSLPCKDVYKKYIKWSVIKTDQMLRYKAALVVEVQLQEGTVYIVEIEPTPNSYRALIFRPLIEDENISNTISDALNFIVEKRGILGQKPTIGGNIKEATGWRHHRIKKGSGLNHDSLLSCLCEVAGGT